MKRVRLAVGMLLVAGVATGWGQTFRYETPVRATWDGDAATAVVITWDRQAPGRGTVRYGVTTNDTRSVSDGGGCCFHAIRLTDLQPGTRYVYEAFSSDGFTQRGTFRTAPPAGAPIHFVFHGDLYGSVTETAARGVADQIMLENPDFIMGLGDAAFENFTDTGFDTWNAFFGNCSNMLSGAVFMPTMGGHDTAPNSDYGRAIYQRLFVLPEPSLGNSYYSISVGNIRFISLNTEPDAVSQNEWLAMELQDAAYDTNVTWIITTGHEPPYSYGYRPGSDDQRTNWTPLLTRYEADLMASGHSHNYQRMIPINGVRYLVAGGGGGRLYESAVDEPMQAFATTCYHHVSCHLSGNVMQWDGIRSDGLLFDSVTFTNDRQVRVEPAFPVRGETVRIFYRASQGPLTGSAPVYIHLGMDAFTNALADAPMTWDAGAACWSYEWTVPLTATGRIAFVFHNASNEWHNNYSENWQALLARATVSPNPLTAGTQAAIRYEADMGPLASATGITAGISWNGSSRGAANRIPMTKGAGSLWTCPVAIPSGVKSMAVNFYAGNQRDNNYKRGWTFPVQGPAAPYWPPAPLAAAGSPIITSNPPGALPDNIGDNVDLVMQGPPLNVVDGPLGFGAFGSIWVNTDATNLYLGGYGADLGGSNNVIVLFVGVDTLQDNAWNLWHKSGMPNALDYLCNVSFTEPLDVAIVLGDLFADAPSYPDFVYGGYNFGQGVYYIGTNYDGFSVMSSARVSQFHGSGTNACSTQGDADQRRTARWEVALPWSSMDASGPTAISNIFICGVIASSSVEGNNRYLSRAVLAESAWGFSDSYKQHAYHTVTIRPQRVNLPHADLRGDGIPNAWRQEEFGTPDGPPGDEDSDGDRQPNADEYIAGTSPLDSSAVFAVDAGGDPSGASANLSWPYAPDRCYDVFFKTNLLNEPFQPLASGLTTNRFVPGTSGYYRIGVRFMNPH